MSLIRMFCFQYPLLTMVKSSKVLPSSEGNFYSLLELQASFPAEEC